MVEGFMYRGYTMKQLDEIIDFAKQQMFEPGEKRQMIRPYAAMQFIPPALFSLEQLEQIRAVVREELQAAMKPPVFDASSMTSEELTEHLRNWKSQVQFTHNELTHEQKRSIVEDVKKALAYDIRSSGRVV